MSLEGCSSFTINGGKFTRVTNFMPRVEERREPTIWDDYNHVRPGDVCIERNIATTSVRMNYCNGANGSKQYCLWRDVDARRNLGIARLRGEDSKDRFLYVTYTGPDAFRAFKQDFDQFAHIKNANVAQIFGYNDNERGLPALIFYDPLIPLGRIILTNGDKLSPLLSSYFVHQYSIMRREVSVEPVLVGELWVDPRTGALQSGPYVEQPLYESWLMGHFSSENAIPNTHSTHLPIQTYSDNDTVFEYLTRSFKARTILQGICWSSLKFTQNLANEQVLAALLYFPGAVHNLHSQNVIASLPGARERWYYGLQRVQGRIPDAMRESQVVVDNGSVRFTFMSTEMQGLQELDLHYTLYPKEMSTLAGSWLAQAHGVFSQLRIHEDDWKDYALLDGFRLRFIRTAPHKEPITPSRVYLHIPFIPRPSDEKTVWRSWMNGGKYFWSFDPLGAEPGAACSGLPSFDSTVTPQYKSWLPSHYCAVHNLRISKGFGPITADFAPSLGFPILKIIGDDYRFKDLEDSSSGTSPLAGGLEPRDTLLGTDNSRIERTGESPNQASGAKKRGRVDIKSCKTPNRTETSRLRQQQDNARKPQGLRKAGASQEDATLRIPGLLVTTVRRAGERNPQTSDQGHRSTSMLTTNTVQPRVKTHASVAPSAERTGKQVTSGSIDPKDHAADRKLNQPNARRREDAKAKKPVWR